MTQKILGGVLYLYSINVAGAPSKLHVGARRWASPRDRLDPHNGPVLGYSFYLWGAGMRGPSLLV